jgi:iron complex outermembrane receptor protein
MPDTAFNGQSFNQGKSEGETRALYGHLNWRFTDKWELGFGLRANDDTRTQRHIETGIVAGSCTNTQPGDNSPLEMCRPIYELNRATLIESGVTFAGEADFSETTGQLSLSYHLTPGNRLDNGMWYGLISEGYLHGAFNDEISPTGGTAAQNAAKKGLIPYGAEFVTNYEIGFKGTFADGRWSLNADIFYMDYTDKQETIDLDNSSGQFGPDPNFEYTVNAGEVDIVGLEIEFRSAPWEGGFISLDVGTLDHEYREFLAVDIADPTGPLLDNSGLSIDNLTPDWTVTATVEHAFLMGNGATLTPMLNVYAQDGIEYLPRGSLDDVGGVSTHCHQDSYTKLRARLTYADQAGRWQASLFGYNITDEEILFRCRAIRSGVYGRWLQAPAQWGLEFQMNFGGV